MSLEADTIRRHLRARVCVSYPYRLDVRAMRAHFIDFCQNAWPMRIDIGCEPASKKDVGYG
jgi:hypothetical protein